jgi:hypothetical protein
MSAADEPLNGSKTVADGSGDETPPRRRSFLSVLRHPLTWASRLIIQFRQDNPRQQLTILYQVVGMTGLLIAGGIGLSRFRSVLVGLVKFGDIYKAQDQRDTAAESYRNALVIAQKLTQRDPTNVLWQSDVAEVLWDLAEIGIDQRQNLEAVVKTLEPIEKSRLLSETQRKFLPQAKKKLAEFSGAR